mgnify:FL=1
MLTNETFFSGFQTLFVGGKNPQLNTEFFMKVQSFTKDVYRLRNQPILTCGLGNGANQNRWHSHDDTTHRSDVGNRFSSFSCFTGQNTLEINLEG